MNRQNLFSDTWDGENEEDRTRHRVFWRPDDARMGATLYELAPDAPEMRMHMHFGAEEMFFVLGCRPIFRNQRGEEELAPGDFVFCPEGRAGLHTFSNRTEEPAQILAISAGSFPDVVAYPEHGYAWVATRDPDPELLARGGDPGIIAHREFDSTHRLLHERRDLHLVGGGQLLQRVGRWPHRAFVELRGFLEAERRVPRLELRRALEEADDLAVLGVRGHSVPRLR